MEISLRQAVCGFALAMLFTLSGHSARAVCLGGPSDLSDSVCEAQDFVQADASLKTNALELSATLAPADQLKLREAQAAFLRRRTRSCTKSTGGEVFIDYACADRLTQARLAVLQLQAAAPVTPPDANGHYSVPGTAMPWNWGPGGLNAGYPFGRQDGTGPVVLTLARLNAGPGQRLIIRYVSGEISAGSAWPLADANGIESPYANAGAGFPSKYMHPYPIHLGALVGAFADTIGVLASAPFALGDGPDLKLIPPGASQLQFGINDNVAADNSGSLVISVIKAPDGDVAGAGSGRHGCAVFGGAVGPLCQNYPAWKSGLWLPPPGNGELHVLAVGGGGGGALANPVSGVGGAGGGSGKVIVANMPIPDSPIEISVGQGGTGAPKPKQPGAGGTGTIFGDLVARGGWGGQPGSGGSADGFGGNSGGGGGGGGTLQASFDAGSGGMGGSGGGVGNNGNPPTDIEAGWNGSAGGAGAAFPIFDFSDLVFGAGPGGLGGGYGSGGLTATGASCAGGGGGGGGAGGVLMDNAGPRAQSAAGPAVPKPCGTPAMNGQGGLGYGAGGGGGGAGIAGPAGSGADGVVYVEW
jgi:uncharacterized protein YecT (DUF1311 family)